VRIISGTARGRQLTTFSGKSVRPTPDKVRGAIFSMLFSRMGSLANMKILDLCSGSGAMAIEALSRGAGHAWLVDDGAQARTIIPANLVLCGFTDRSTFIRRNAFQALDQLLDQRPFDLIFLDPPYGKNLVPAFLEAISAGRYLSATGIVCSETAKTDEIPDRIGDLMRIEQRTYGITAIHLFRRDATETEV